MKTIGILAVQGAFEAHARAVRDVGHQAVLVRSLADLSSRRLNGFIFPGGESTVQLDLIERLELEEPLREMIASGIPILATCAGLILLASEVTHPHQRSFSAIDVTVARNGWGRQVDSFEALSDDPDHARELIFIRAPRITRVGADVEVVDTFDGEPVLVRSKNIICATYHPELGEDRELHLFAKSVHLARRTQRKGSSLGLPSPSP
jgi:pyridoxal 5'-phosphate synthase pdxT subunit